MSSKVINKNAKELAEEKELEEFIAKKQEKRKGLFKSIVIIIVCVALVIAFCLPGVLPLLMTQS